jgi:hypothetical protein
MTVAATSNIVQVESFLQKMVTAAAPVVENSVHAGINIAAEVVRISSIQYEVTGVLLMAGALIVLSQANKYIKWIKKDWAGWEEGMCVLAALLGIGGGVLSCIFAINGIHHLANVWEWTGIFEPKLQLAHLAIQKVLGATK